MTVRIMVDVREETNVSLDEVIEAGGLEGFLDLLSECVGHPLLQDINYEVLSVNEDGSLKVLVTGQVEADREECDECGNEIPSDTPIRSIVNEHHKESCSLHPKNVVEEQHGQGQVPAMPSEW